MRTFRWRSWIDFAGERLQELLSADFFKSNPVLISALEHGYTHTAVALPNVPWPQEALPPHLELQALLLLSDYSVDVYSQIVSENQGDRKGKTWTTMEVPLRRTLREAEAALREIRTRELDLIRTRELAGISPCVNPIVAEHLGFSSAEVDRSKSIRGLLASNLRGESTELIALAFENIAKRFPLKICWAKTQKEFAEIAALNYIVNRYWMNNFLIGDFYLLC